MTDAPIPRNYRVDGHTLTVPVPDELLTAFNDWLGRHYEEIVALYEPFGVHPYELTPPTFERYVTLRDADDLQEQFAWERKALAREGDTDD